MVGHVISFAVATLATCVTAADPAGPESTTLYRFEKRVAAHAIGGESPKLAAEAYFVGLLAVSNVGEEKHVEEYLTGGLLSDLGEDLPPRPAGDPLRRNYVLNKAGEIVSPVFRRNSLVVWPLLFEFFAMPEQSTSEVLAQRNGVRQFSSHVARLAVRGTWAWQVEPQKVERPTFALYGPFSGKLDEFYPVGGSMGRAVDRSTGAVRSATADVALTIPVSARLQALAESPERRAEEERFFQGYDAILIGETARMHRDKDATAGAIELPGSLSTALARLRQGSRAD